jgi:hypothetical protein
VSAQVKNPAIANTKPITAALPFGSADFFEADFFEADPFEAESWKVAGDVCEAGGNGGIDEGNGPLLGSSTDWPQCGQTALAADWSVANLPPQGHAIT